MPATASTHELVRVLQEHWGLRGVDMAPTTGGMNSRTWSVTGTGAPERWVAKVVPARDRAGFRLGLRAAAALEAAGTPAGAPEPSRSGDLAVDLPGGCLALLRWVDGDALTGRSEDEQVLIGQTLAAAHAVLVGASGQDGPRFPWIDPEAPHLGVENWVRPAVRDALSEYDRLARRVPLTWGLLHGDPEPGAFLWSPPVGRCALIDWGSAFDGPVLYDVASAVMYLGGPARAEPFLRAYAAGGVLSPGEVSAGLEPVLRLRQAVQADYFARRTAAGDLTGIGDASGNDEGLRAASAFFHP